MNRRKYSYLFLFILFYSISLFSEPKALLPPKIRKSPNQVITEAKGKLPILNQFDVKLYLFPDRKSDVLRLLNFAEMISLDEKSMEPLDDIWLPIKTKDGMIGFVPRTAVRLVPSKSFFRELIFECDKALKNSQISLAESMKITNALQARSSAGEFVGDDFNLLKTKVGFALKVTLDKANALSLGPNQSTEWYDFLKVHQSKILYDEVEKKYYVDPEYFWKILDFSPRSKHADYIAYMASESLPVRKCPEKDLACELEQIRLTKLRYLSQFPSGNYAEIYFRDVNKRLSYLTNDSDSIPCFPPISKFLKSEIESLSKYVSSFSAKRRKILSVYAEKLRAECLK
ncbi:hypothetical protein LPTSP4_21820 [Leptospira ryugenii]|uniref:SH3 domain-containing protein n=1 Tax=Leptospira ryugenii TaxID=1917863 RepID=A0A2P2E193_9LEPT|nr:SH3 domain-containing protein [Leptospira ryugenii]GBF50655.1 hypothetical protein LPTSP4_21820 [Leptospira ryugenii]